MFVCINTAYEFSYIKVLILGVCVFLFVVFGFLNGMLNDVVFCAVSVVAEKGEPLASRKEKMIMLVRN